jgi:apolipoprotein D and lipocalin family protein
MSMKILLIATLLTVAPMALLGMGAQESLPPLEVVPQVDVSRYMGTWYEIARFPHRFQEGCVATKATYTLRQDGKVDVLNECRMENLDGAVKTAKGTARVVDEKTNAKLKVTFFWPFYGSYWIIGLGDNYEYAVVGHPGRNYLWILSRTPSMDDALYNRIVRRLQNEQAYDTSKLVKTLQSKPETPGPTSEDPTKAAGVARHFHVALAGDFLVHRFSFALDCPFPVDYAR